MPDSSTLLALVAAANANLSDPERNRVMRPRDGETVRFELYHAGLSICSQKVLAEKKEPYTSHEMVIVAGHGIFTDDFKPAENYRPSYVRLRMFGGAQLGKSCADQQRDDPRSRLKASTPVSSLCWSIIPRPKSLSIRN